MCGDEANQFPFLRPRAADTENQRYFTSCHGAWGVTGASTAPRHPFPPLPRGSGAEGARTPARSPPRHPAASSGLFPLLAPERVSVVCDVQVTSTFSCHLNYRFCPRGFSICAEQKTSVVHVLEKRIKIPCLQI